VNNSDPLAEVCLRTTVDSLPVPCQCILSLANFNINNQENFQTNSSIHNINTRKKHHLHRPNAKPTYLKKKSTFFAAIKIFNSLSPRVTTLKNDKANSKQPKENTYIHTPFTL
jgi:hypothetical protein